MTEIKTKSALKHINNQLTPDTNNTESKQEGDLKVPLRCWMILFISSAGVLMASISTSALIIAFPVILIDLDTTLDTMMWILLIILLMIGAIVGIAGIYLYCFLSVAFSIF